MPVDKLDTLVNSFASPWIGTLVASVATMAIALVVWFVVRAALMRIARLHVIASKVLARASRPMLAAVPLLALQFVLGVAPADLAYLPTIAHVASVAFIAALTWLVVRVVGGLSDGVIALHPANVSDNLEARRVQTQARVLSRTATFLVCLIGLAAALMTLPNMRQIGASLLASAGMAGLVAGFAARPVLGNVIAGLQIALTQPIRLDDVVIMEGEWGRIEEITSTYVVVKIWDERRLVVPLQWVIEHPFQNWTRSSASLLGSVFLWVDYRVAIEPIRAELVRVCEADPAWDGRVAIVQVVETSERAMQLRVLVSSADAPRGWDLRCRVREALVAFIQRHDPEGLPRLRADVTTTA
ncbi:MAG: mechanosensitive ion channel family protein [Burkholderiales bacterium]|nr:mechanosensitive ion channel family protein [Burkholderiales bacterium]